MANRNLTPVKPGTPAKQAAAVNTDKATKENDEVLDTGSKGKSAETPPGIDPQTNQTKQADEINDVIHQNDDVGTQAAVENFKDIQPGDNLIDNADPADFEYDDTVGLDEIETIDQDSPDPRDKVIMELRAEIARRDQLLRAANIEVVDKQVIVEKKLPREDQIDRDDLESPVLTQQGWVLPTKNLRE